MHHRPEFCFPPIERRSSRCSTRPCCQDLLSLDLPLELVGTLIDDESYWKRRACLRWKSCDVIPHGRSWKQLYFERHLEAWASTRPLLSST